MFTRRAGVQRCSVADCERKVFARGICAAHYNRERRGTSSAPPVRDRRAPIASVDGRCSAADCEREVAIRGLCWRHYSRERRYGLSPADFAALLASQGGACAICRGVARREWFVDHDHATKRVRGILCPSCNTALGLFAESLERMRAAIGYLAREVA